ncbi:MAG: ABC transporter permease [Bacteroidales bacterium]|jgi:ABC-2 type transport system permease protein|nr:ABC transporter permease [Bacteroidales bacterium]
MLKYLLEKEFKQFSRNKLLPRLVTVFPLVIVLVFPFVANFEIKNINLSIIDNDKTSYSQEMIQKIESSGYFRITNVSSTYSEALKNIELDKADVILEIPSGFERSFVKEAAAQVLISANAVNGSKGTLATSYLTQIIYGFNSEVRTQLVPNLDRQNAYRMEILPLFRYNPYLSYKVFMIPAIMVMLLAIICGFLPALNIVGEKENGTIEQMNVTPVSKFNFILSKLIPYWVFGFIALTICFFIAFLVYWLIPKGSFLTIYLFVALFTLAFSGFGLVISNYAKSTQQAMFMMFFFVVTFILMSGLYTPIDNMPHWAKGISYVSPLRYIIQVFRMVYLKGSGFFDLLPQFFALLGFAVFFNVWAVLSYKKRG